MNPVATIETLGAMTVAMVQQLGSMAAFTRSTAGAVLSPPWRGRQFVTELYKLGVLSLVIIGVSGLAVGMVLGLQGYNTLVRFGSEEALGAVVGLSLVRELGPVLTALLVTGRAGSATTAEIGTMVATEQLDGLRMMSVDPLDYVVGPRALGMIVVMPLLTAIFIAMGLFGGLMVGSGLMGIDSGTYLTSMESSIDFGDDVIGSIVKSLIFGIEVALVSTYRGYHCAPTSAGVSRATTSTVVTASLCILISDYFITALWGVGP
jgi:phospholipid/cholesterol/gamma-HCH transport system permease protein